MSAPRVFLSGTAIAALLASALMASAQAVSFADIDDNGDNVLSLEELEKAFGQATAPDMLLLYDRDGDGEVSLSEARALSREGATNAAAGMRKAADNKAAAQERRAAAQEKAETARSASGRPDFAGPPEGRGNEARGNASEKSQAGGRSEGRGSDGRGNGSERSQGLGRP
jgi:hypothetical protein